MTAEMKEHQVFIATSENGRNSCVEYQHALGERREAWHAADTVKAQGSRETITQVSQWLNEHPPSHDIDGLTAGLTFSGKRVYSTGSAAVSG